MKIDRSRLRKSTSEVPPECQALIDRLRACSRTELLDELSKIKTWTFGKCELYHWIGVLDIFDSILEEATMTSPDNRWALYCDTNYNSSEKKLLLWTLHFTTLLIEHSFSRHLYNSMEHLLALLSSSNMSVVLGVLNLLYMFSKRSNFITRLVSEKRTALLSRLHHLAESWGGKENGFGLADCCNPDKSIPPSATTLHFEFHRDYTNNEAKEKEAKDIKFKQGTNYIHVEHVDKITKTPAEIMKLLVALYYVPPDKEMWLFTHVRLAHHFADYKIRLLCVQARLQALSVLVYSNALQDSAHTLLYNGLLEELVELVELKQPYLVEIRSAALRTLTSIIHLDRNPHFPKKPGSRLTSIIDVTGASQYHGFLPVLVRNCIASLTRTGSKIDTLKSVSQDADESHSGTSEENPEDDDSSDDPSKYIEYVFDVAVNSQLSDDLKMKFPLPLATALFSFLYHLASYEAGGEALVSCGMMESLLQVINWHGIELEHITFVTRAVRVIDLITNIDMQAFHTHGGLQSFISRLDVEVNLCSKEQSYEFKPIEKNLDQAGPSDIIDDDVPANCEFQYNATNMGKTCLPQRAALLKSMLNFLKKALQDSTFADNIRHLMEGTLPSSLKHIISNAEYYGPSLFLLATDVVTVYVFQEPSLLSALQDNGLTDVVLHALLIKDVPATREVLGSLPNVFSALCLNSRGLSSFVKCKPFERLFKVLLSPNYLSAMRRRRSSDPLGDTASNLGNAMDELMRHQPSLKVDATAAIVKLLDELCHLGSDPKYICWRPHSKSDPSPSSTPRPAANTEGSSDEEEEDEEEASTSSHNAQNDSQEHTNTSEKTPIALVDYILNVMKFIDAILSNNSTDDHCREFVTQGGLTPLLKILGLPNLPVDCPVTASAQAVASVCKSILNLAHEPKVLKQGLLQLSEVLDTLKPLYSQLDQPGGSKLLHELANASHLESAFSTSTATPLLHAMGAAHGYVLMFVHVCRTGQSEIRTLSLQHWGSDEGLSVLKNLAELYTSLVWESTLLLALCSDDVIPADCNFGREDMEKLNIPICEKFDSCSSNGDAGTVASAMEALTTNPPPVSMEIDGEPIANNKPTSQQLKYIKPLLGASSRLGRALAELFGLLVKLCVGTPIRLRRGQNIVSTPPLPSPYAKSVATALNCLLANGLNSERLPPSPVPKFRLTFLICSVGFTSPMLFDEKRYPYHLMLQKFVNLGGQQTFFNTFKWALSAGGTIPLEEGLEHPNLPDGTGEFLDAWLMLLEKMVNPKGILETPHIISLKPLETIYDNKHVFDPLKYVIRMQKLAFDAVILMWGRKPLPSYGVRMSETILSILRHILRAEKIINERLSTKPEDKSESASSSTSSSNEHDVNPENLRQLMDMGFSKEHATEALLHTLNVEQATDYLLSNPPLLRAQPDVEMSEDDQVLQAIAMSLSDAGPSEPVDVTFLTNEAITRFTHAALPVCLDLIEVIPETVYKVCDLLVSIMKRNGPDFRDRLLDKLLSEIRDSVTSILNKNHNVSGMYHDLYETEKALRLGYYTHLYTLFFEVPSYFDMRIPCGFAVHRADVVPYFIKLIALAESYLSESEQIIEPKWLTPILLLLDSLGKVSTCTQRKYYMHLVTTRVWKWYDMVTGKWTAYSTSNNKLINDAYWNGEQSIRVTCGRRRYTITFSNMLQMNDESGNNRPISMTPVKLAQEAKYDKDTCDAMDIDEVILSEKEHKRCTALPSFVKQETIDIVRSCVKLMHLQIDKDLLHAIIRVCLRFTRHFDSAKIFVQEGGVKCLLNMRQTSAFSGYGTLATVLIRHTLEEPTTLAHAIEKVIRGRTLLSIPPPYKELMYLTRQIGGAVARSPETFLEVAKSILRVDISIFRRNEEVDNRLPLRSEPSVRTHVYSMEEEVSVEVIYDLLNALLQPLELNVPEVPEPPPKTQETPPSFSGGSSRGTMYQRATVLLSNNSISSEILNMDNQDDSTPVTPILRVKLSRSSSESNFVTKFEQELARKPLLAKHSLLKMLADAVVSYAAVAKHITDFTYKVGCNDIITEDCSALAFIFDKLLPMTENISDRDCSMMCRMLIAAIASCNHSPEAQAALVSEIKSALVRALLMTESFEKHTQVQLITGIITTVIENCPPAQQIRSYKNQPLNGQMNNIVKMMLRKGIFNDLARVPHCLDLSSPNFCVTVNSALKPMEALSRIVNQPISGHLSGRIIKKSQQNTLDDNGTTQSGATSTEATNAQGEETIEDTENTEHDISAVASSLEANPEVTGVSEGDHVLDDIMDQLLDRGNSDINRSYSEVTSERNHHAMDIDEEVNRAYVIERDATEELMSTDSGDSDSNASDQEVEDDDENEENEVDDEIDEADENEDNNYDEETVDGSELFDDNSGIFLAPNGDRDDILMIQIADHDAENETLPVVRWNENGFAIPIFDEANNTNDQPAPPNHPLLISRHSNDNNTTNFTRTQRTNRARRYQYLQLNPRNPNPPVILQRLLGPTTQNISLASNQVINSPGLRDSARVVVMDNFGLFPSSEEQIDFVDQSGYLFGPSLAATLNHVPSVLHWWNEESKLLDYESTHDITTYVCNKLVPNLIRHRNIELAERKRKKDEEDTKTAKNTPKDETTKQEANQEPSLIDFSVLLSDNVQNNSGSDEAQSQDSPDPAGAQITHTTPSIAQPIPVVHLPHRYAPSRADANWLPVPSATNITDAERSLQDEENSGYNYDNDSNNGDNITDAERAEQEGSGYGYDIDSNNSDNMTEVERLMQHHENVDYPYPIESFSPFDMPDFNSMPTLHEENSPPEPTNLIFSRVLSPPSLELFGENRPNERPEDPNEDNRDDPSPPLFSPRMYSSSFSLLNGAPHRVPVHYTPAESSSLFQPQRAEGLSTAQSDTTDDIIPVSQPSTAEQNLEQNERNESNSDVVMVEGAGSSGDSSEEIPDGVDPSFLEALPADMRREVLEQHRLLRLQQRASGTSDQPVASGSAEVSPEFLAALPPSLQEEVLTQQRLEQQRQAAARSNPDEPVDAGAFFETLQPSLRTMILSDMEDSQMSALPPDLAAEAQTLRRDWEARNRQMVQDRYFQSNLTTIIRHSRARLGSRLNAHLLPQRTQWSSWGRAEVIPSSPGGNIRVRGRQLLDHESLSCLLVLLFTDDPKLNTLRLHRVIRNLCYHGPTREWIVKALLSIIERSVHVKSDETRVKSRRIPKPGPLTSKLLTDTKNVENGANWLNIRMEAALGCHANVFIVNRALGKRNERNNPSTITIHPQAAPVVCKNALDLFISLSKSFPTFLLPLKAKDDKEEKTKTTVSPLKSKTDITDFWDMLLKLDSASAKKGKSLAKAHINLSLLGETESILVPFEQSAFGQLLCMLSSPVICRSMQLTDKLLRLLSVITLGMPELSKSGNAVKSLKNKIHKFESVSAPESALNLAVNVLTYKSCSEEGLEDVTNLLLNLANCSLDMSYVILNLLLSGAMRIGEVVREQIRNMLVELSNLNNVQKRKQLEEAAPSSSKGTVNNRFTNETVIITASSKVKASCDLQLPSMTPLTSKTSSQIFFLRVLRVIVQIREAIKKGLKKEEEEKKKSEDPPKEAERDLLIPDTSTSRHLQALSDQLQNLEILWETLSQCLLELEHTPDHHAVLVLQPAVEAFFLVHSPQQSSTEGPPNKSPSKVNEPEESAQGSSNADEHGSDNISKVPVPPDQLKFLSFAEKHRTVLNQILRQTTAHLSDGPFSVLVDHTKVLDFDVKRRYFRTELERMDQGIRREETAVHVRRSHIFEDSFRELYRRSPEEWKNRFYIVFEDEEGQDAGGLLREWYVIISRDIFNPMYALFTVSPGDRVTYMINSASHYNPNHLCYYKFVGRVIAKAIYDNKLLECYFTRSFYKHILGIPVKYTDMESEDYSFYRGLVYLMENNIDNLGYDLTFSTEINEFGVTETRDLIANGRNVPVTEENKMEYIRLSCQMKMTGAIRQQLNAFLEGFYDIIPMRLISIFNEQELELLISGLPNIDIDDLKANTEYHKYQSNSLQIQWFWRALRSFDQADRAKFLQFVTGTSKVPLQGFAHLEGMNGVQKFQIHRDDRSTDRLPSAHTCFNQLDLPVYETYDKLRSYLLKAIHECSEGFGFA